MADLTLRNVKGSPLTNQEVDDNFSNLNTDKAETAAVPSLAREAVGSITYDLTGFPSRADSTVSLNESTRVFTLSPTGASFTVYYQGEEHVISSALSLTITNQSGGRYIKYNPVSGALEEGTINGHPSLLDDLLVAYIFWDSVNQKAIIFGEERHSSHRDTQWHLSQHLDVGAVWRSGGTLAYTLDSNDATISVSAPVVIADEDLVHTILHGVATNAYEQVLNGDAEIPTIYLNGTNTVQTTPTISPWKKGTSAVQYNPITAGSGSLVEASNNSYICYWLIATNDTRYPIKGIMGHYQHSNIADAEDEEFDSFGFSVPELCPMYQVVLRASTSATYGCQIAAVYELGGRKSTATAGFSASSHENLSDRSLSDQHPIAAITGLQTALDSKVTGTGGTYNNVNWDTAYGWGNHSTQGYATQTYVNTAVSNLVDSAPATLDTLNELAAALGDDPNFATTVSTSIGTKWTQDNTKISNWDAAYTYSQVDHLPRSGGTLTGNVTINNSTSFYLDDAGTGTPSRLWRAGGNATRFEYYDNVFIFDAKDNADFQIRDSADAITFSHAPNSGNTEITGRLFVPGGSVTAPAITFTGDTDTGIYSTSADHINVTTGGTARAYFNSSGINSLSNVYTANGGSFRNYAGTWAASTGLTGNGFQFINSIDGTAMTISSTGTVQATTDFRAQIFYDSNNTAFYVNQAATSKLHSLHLGASGQILASSAALQVNGFMRTGNIIVHDGGNTPNTAEQTVLSATGGELYRTSSNGGSTYKFYDTGNFNPSNYLLISNYHDYYVTSAGFNTGTGVLTLTRNDGGTVTVDLDGRYLTSETDSQTLSWNGSTGQLSISNGNTVDLDGRYLEVAGDTMTGQLTMNAPIVLSTGNNITGGRADTSATSTVLQGVFNNPADEDLAVQDPRLVNDLAGAHRWATIENITGLYKTRSGSVGTYTYSNPVTSGDAWQNAFDGLSSTAGSWYSDNGVDGTTQGEGSFEVNFNGVKHLTYTCFVGIVFGSGSFTAKRVKIETYRNGAWQTECDLYNNSDVVVLRQVAGNNSAGVQKIRYTLGHNTNTYFRIHTLFAANYSAGSSGGERWQGVHYLPKYSNAYGHGHYFPGTTDAYSLGDNTYTWNTSYVGNSYASMFYDKDNTAYYSNPAGTSNLANLHVGSSASFADGTDADISVGTINIGSRLVTPKIALYQDAAGDDAYITATDVNTAYSVCGQDMGAWFEFYGDKIGATGGNSAGLVASGLKSFYVEASSQVRSPIYYDSNNTSYYVDPASTSNINILNVATINRDPTVTVNLTGDVTGSGSATLTNLGDATINVTTSAHSDGFGDLYTFTESIQLTTEWQDTSISGSDLPTGSYVVQVLAYDNDAGGGQYNEHYTGYMSWFSAGTNDTAAQEIPLHNTGHADNDRAIFLRTKRNPNPGFVVLQIAGRTNNTAADDYVIKFRRMI